MARPATPDVRITEALQPTASPLGIYDRPAQPEPSPLHGVAQALASVSSDLDAWANRKRTEQMQEDRIQGAAAAANATADGWAEGVRTDQIPANKSPWYTQGYKQAMGAAAGYQLEAKVGAAWDDWGDKYSGDPASFDKWYRDTTTGLVKTTDPWVLKGLMPHMQELHNRYFDKWQKAQTQNAEYTAQAGYTALAASKIDDAVQDSIQDQEGLNIESLGASLDAVRDAGYKSGMKAEKIDQALIDSITTQALTHRNGDLLALLDRKSTTGVSLADTPYGRDQKMKTEDSLVSLNNRLTNEEYTRQQREQKAAANLAIAKVYDSIIKDPSAPVDDKLINAILPVHPEFKKNIMEWQDAVIKHQVQDDPRQVSKVFSDILSGGGDPYDKIRQANLEGVLRDPQNMQQALTYAATVAKAGQASGGILNSANADNYVKQITLAGQQPDLPGATRGPFDPIALTDGGRKALNDYRFGLLVWSSQNPKATPLEINDFAAKLGESILKGFSRGADGVSKDYTSPPSTQQMGVPKTAPLTIDQAPAAAKAVLDRVTGGQQPQAPQAPAPQPQAPAPQAPTQPTLPATPGQATQGPSFTPEQMQRIEQKAKELNVQPQQIMDAIKRKMLQQRSDASGGSAVPFAAITPVSLIETAQRAARNMGLSGVISSQPQQPQSPQTAENQVINSARVNRIRNSSVGPVLQQVAQRMGFDPDKLMAIASIESGGNPTASTGSYHGLFQLSQAEFAKYGDGGDIYDPQANALAAVRSLQDKSARFSREFGREPSATELYLMHQQGEAGLRAHEQRPDAPAWSNMARTGEGRQKGERWAKLAVWGNVPTDMRHYFGSVDNITSRQFLAVWTSKILGVSYEQALAMNGGGGDRTASLEDETRG